MAGSALADGAVNKPFPASIPAPKPNPKVEPTAAFSAPVMGSPPVAPALAAPTPVLANTLDMLGSIPACVKLVDA